MAFQPATGIAQVTVEQTLRGELGLNILHFEDSGGWDPTSLAALADLIKTDWLSASGISSRQSNQVQITRVIARDLTVEAGAEVISTVADGPGRKAAAALENSIAACVTLGTGLAGRSYRGRIYVMGISNDAVVSAADPNHLATGDAAALATAAQYTCTNGLEVTQTHVVLSRQNDLVMRPDGIGTEVRSYTVNARLDNQRRRMPRV